MLLPRLPPRLLALAGLGALPLGALPLGCEPTAGGAGAAQRYAEALRTGACAEAGAPELRDDCRLAHLDAAAAEPCAGFETERLRDECFFQLAEARKDAALCPRAGAFADDCALHVLSRGFGAWVGPGTRPGDREEEVAAHIAAAGLAGDDMRPWSAWYRWVLGGLDPLDRAACDAVAEPARREACRATAVAVFHDRLNNARDRRLVDCATGALPPLLAHTPDPELDAALRRRWTELCPPPSAPSAP